MQLASMSYQSKIKSIELSMGTIPTTIFRIRFGRVGGTLCRTFAEPIVHPGRLRQRLFEVRVTPSPTAAIRFRAFLDRFVSERSDNLQEKEAFCGLTFLRARACSRKHTTQL